MATKVRGIEVFGRGATTVTAQSREPHGALIGVIALLLAFATIALLVLAVRAEAANQSPASVLAIAAIISSILGALFSLIAVVGNRGRRIALWALLLCVAANPWLLTRTLEYAEQFAMP